jgi:Putative MetA-pathway of phenol degradation
MSSKRTTRKVRFNGQAALWCKSRDGASPTPNLTPSSSSIVTFNAKNPATDYKDGDDFIWDWAVGKKLQDMSANGT